LKIFFILHLPPPVHGAAMVGQTIFNSHIIRQKYETVFINLSTSQKLDEIGKYSIRKTFIFLKIIFNVLKNLITNKFGLCYITLNSKGSGFYKDFLIVFLVKFFRVKTVYHFHNKGVKDYQDRTFDNILYKVVFRKSKSILLSPLLYYDIEKYVKRRDVYFCPNGIEPVMEWRRENTSCDERVSILFLSNMMKAKGVFDLLAALKILMKRNIDFKADFVGKWDDIPEDDFGHYIHENGLTNVVTAHGPKFNKEKSPFLMNADIFSFPSHNDCFPLVLLEAMSFGLPVVSTIEGGIPEIVKDGETGFLVKPGNIEEIAGKLEILIMDRSLRKQMGKAGRERFESHFTIDRFERNFNKILHQVLISTVN